MDGLQIALVALAAYYAVRSLLGLMRNHEAELRARKAAEEARSRPKPPSSAARPAA